MPADNESLSIWIRLRDANRFRQELKKSSREIRELRREAQQGGKDFRLLGTTLRITGVAGVLAAQGIGTATAAVFALGSAVAPVTGLVGALPGLLMVATQGLQTFKLGAKGVGDAVGALNETIDLDKLSSLSAPAQELALALDDLKDPIRDLQGDIGAELMPGLLDGLKAANPLMDALKPGLLETGDLIGGLGRRLGEEVSSAGFLGDLADQASFNNVQLGRLGNTGFNLLDIFRDLMVTSRGLVGWLIRGAETLSRTAAEATAAGRASGGLERGFHTIQVTTSRVLRLFWNLGVAIFNIGRISKRQIGDGILVYLLRASIALRDWTESAGGIAKINNLFDRTGDRLRAMRDWMKNMREEAGPDLAAFFRNLMDALNPIIASEGGAVTLGLYARALALLAGAAALIVNNVPGASTALSALFAAMILNKITGVNLLARGFMALGAAFLGTSFGASIATAAFWRLNAAMTANPAILIGLAILAVAAGLVYAYHKVGWFRSAVQSVFGWIKDNWPLLLAILTGPVGLAILTIVKNFDTIKGAAKSAINAVISIFNAGIGLINSLTPGPIKVAGKTIIPGIPDIPPIPMLAKGGIASGLGSFVTGEAGPELNTILPGGRVRVDPLPGIGPGTPPVTPPPNVDTRRPLVAKVYLGKRLIGEAVAEDADDELARR